MKRCPFLDDIQIGASFTLPGNNPVPCCLYDRASLPVLEAVVRCDTEVYAPRVPEILDVDTSDCAYQLDFIQLLHRIQTLFLQRS